jgi:hypothetical protein
MHVLLFDFEKTKEQGVWLRNYVWGRLTEQIYPLNKLIGTPQTPAIYSRRKELQLLPQPLPPLITLHTTNNTAVSPPLQQRPHSPSQQRNTPSNTRNTPPIALNWVTLSQILHLPLLPLERPLPLLHLITDTQPTRTITHSKVISLTHTPLLSLVPKLLITSILVTRTLLQELSQLPLLPPH